MKKIFSLIILFIFFTHETISQGCSMCRGIVESDANSGGTGISSSINSGIVYLFTSTYVLIIIGAVFGIIGVGVMSKTRKAKGR